MRIVRAAHLPVHAMQAMGKEPAVARTLLSAEQLALHDRVHLPVLTPLQHIMPCYLGFVHFPIPGPDEALQGMRICTKQVRQAARVKGVLRLRCAP